VTPRTPPCQLISGQQAIPEIQFACVLVLRIESAHRFLRSPRPSLAREGIPWWPLPRADRRFNAVALLTDRGISAHMATTALLAAGMAMIARHTVSMDSSALRVAVSCIAGDRQSLSRRRCGRVCSHCQSQYCAASALALRAIWWRLLLLAGTSVRLPSHCAIDNFRGIMQNLSDW
jgi:hypothetical protein